MKRSLLPVATLCSLALCASSAFAGDAVDLDALTRKTAKSLVLVEYTYKNDNTVRQDEAQGIALNKDGVIAISGSFISEGTPRDFIKDIKVRGPGKQFKEIPATFLGRTTDRLFAFVKADEPIDCEPLVPQSTAEVKLGTDVAAIALAGRLGGYEPYIGTNRVRSILPIGHNVALVGSFGLTRATSPVFDVQTGNMVGITVPPVSDTMTLSTVTADGRLASQTVQLRDEDQSSVFLPWSEVKEVFDNIPTKPFESHRPWIGLDSSGLAGVEEDVRKLYKIDQPSAVTLGALIQGSVAEKAGIQTKDIVLAVNGKEFSKSIVPEIMVSQFQRTLEQLKIGEPATFTVLRDGEKKDIKVPVEAAPKLASEMSHVVNAKLGVTTRDLVFYDTYARKIPADTKGVIVALVKQGSPASLGTTPLRAGYLVQKVNDEPVKDESEFAAQLTKATAADASEVVFVVLLPSGDTQVCRIDLSK